MLNRIFAVFALLALTGCATLKPMDQSSVNDMRANDVAVGVAYPEQRINYDEMVYKVLWNETRSTTASFKGIWDVNRDLSEQFAEKFRGEDLKAVSVAEVLSAEDYAAFNDRLGAYKPKLNEKEPADFELDKRLRDALLNRGIEYLIAMRAIGVNVHAFSFGSAPIVQLQYRTNVIDLRTNEVKFGGDFWFAAKADVESPRELEDNELAKLRAAIAAGMAAAFDKDIVPKQMGLVVSQSE